MTGMAGHMGNQAEAAIVAELFRSKQACAHNQSKIISKNNMLKRNTRRHGRCPAKKGGLVFYTVGRRRTNAAAAALAAF